MNIFKRKKSGVAFGGGAARGFAHIGIVKVFEESGFKFDYIVGNSAGSIVGALYAAGMSWKEMYQHAKQISAKDIIALDIKSPGLFNSEKLEKLIRSMLGDMRFEDLKVPFRCVAVDLKSGNLVVLSKGELAPAIRASCSIPGIFTPTPLHDKLLVDGGILDSVPGNIAYNMGARFIVGINLNSDRSLFKYPKTGPDTVFSALKIIMNHNTRIGLQKANIIIEPDLKHIAHHEIRKLDELVALGEKAARQHIKTLKRHLKI